MRHLKKILKRLWMMQFKYAVSEVHLTNLAEKKYFSLERNNWDLKSEEEGSGIGGWFPINNHSSGYHGILQQWWEHYGFGENCLLVSESSETSQSFKNIYKETNFVSTDYYLDISETSNMTTDIVWNLYHEPPENIINLKIESVLFQATLEHLIDPITVMKHLVDVVQSSGYIFIHTHTPLYPYHACPRDYLRYQVDWFEDIGDYIEGIVLVELVAQDGHIFSCFKKL